MNQSESISQRLAEKVEWRRRKRRLRRRDLTPESLEIERLKRDYAELKSLYDDLNKAFEKNQSETAVLKIDVEKAKEEKNRKFVWQKI